MLPHLGSYLFISAGVLAAVVATAGDPKLPVRDTKAALGANAYAGAPVRPARRKDRAQERFLLTNRLMDTSCVLEREGRRVRALGACTQTFEAAHRIVGWRDSKDGVTLIDPVGSAVAEFAWNEETGMSSLSSPLHPEAGALALLPVPALSASEER